MCSELDPPSRALMFGWFGRPWSACLREDGTPDEDMRLPVPLGQACLWCAEAFASSDSGQATPVLGEGVIAVRYTHRECLLRSVVGSLDHLARRCTCCAPTGSPDGLGSLSDGLTRRQEALAVDEFVARYGPGR